MFKHPSAGAFMIALAVACFGVSADAAVVGYTLKLSGDHDIPTMRLTNDSAAAKIDAFSLTIGDTDFNYNEVENRDGTGGPDSIAQDSPSIGDRSDVVKFTFSGFEPSEYFQFDVDIDEDSSETIEDYRQVLFDLDGSESSDNALSTVTFSDGQELSGRLLDFASNDSDTYVFSQSTAIPLPGAGMMGLALLGGLGFARSRRRRRSA